MKKFILPILVLFSLIIGGCSLTMDEGGRNSKIDNTNKDSQVQNNVSKDTNNQTVQNDENQQNLDKQKEENIDVEVELADSDKEFKVDNSMFGDKKIMNPKKEEKYPYTWKMKKPSLDEMNNFDAITKGFNEEWSQDYTISENDRNSVDSCMQYMGDSTNVKFVNSSNGKTLKEVTLDEFNNMDTIQVTGKYEGDGYEYGGPLAVSGTLLNFFNNHGWVLFNPGWEMVNYEGDGSGPVDFYFFEQEWYKYMKNIGGDEDKTKRYPQNTIFVTTDFMLNAFHVLFANNLKYHEEAVLRKSMGEITNSMYDKFVELYKNEQNSELKTKYEFLSAYWSLASTFFVDEEVLLGENIYNGEDLSDNELKERLKTVLSDRIAVFEDSTKELILKEFDAIMESKELLDNPGHLINHYFPGIMDMNMQIKQDYTQFRPRSHYTTDSLLKTYFMGMKFLMREKFYFVDKDMAKTALLQINHMTDEDFSKFNEIYEFVKKLIGDDDDINIYDLSNFLKVKSLGTAEDISSNFDDSMHQELLKSKKQNIISTSYQTSTFGEVTEQEAHDKTVGFVFFGEKTTIDSWIFDQLTAGTAESETETKPILTTALAIPNIISDNKLAGELVSLWLDREKQNGRLTDNQEQGFKDNSTKLVDQIQFFNFDKNIYHKWLDTLSYLFIERSENAPYFFQDEIYGLKNLLSYMGSYTELKHDTLLYVKQNYAELGAGGDGCTIEIQPPELPVPKGYIEPNIELIDRLIKLAEETNLFYNDDKIKSFIEYLEFIKGIAIKQTKNETISDDEFEKLRLYYKEMQDMLTPKKYIGQPLAKEQRGSIIADIFTSGVYGPLYEAVGRPQLMLLMVKDTNGSRIVVGPVYTHYEFYGDDKVIETDSRLTDENWQNNYDSIKDKQGIKGIEFEQLVNEIEGK